MQPDQSPIVKALRADPEYAADMYGISYADLREILEAGDDERLQRLAEDIRARLFAADGAAGKGGC